MHSAVFIAYCTNAQLHMHLRTTKMLSCDEGFHYEPYFLVVVLFILHFFIALGELHIAEFCHSDK